MSGLFFRSLLVVLGLLWGTGAAGGGGAYAGADLNVEKFVRPIKSNGQLYSVIILIPNNLSGRVERAYLKAKELLGKGKTQGGLDETDIQYLKNEDGSFVLDADGNKIGELSVDIDGSQEKVTVLQNNDEGKLGGMVQGAWNVDNLFSSILNESDFQGFRNLCKHNSKITVELVDDSWSNFVTSTKSQFGIAADRNLAVMNYDGQEIIIVSGKKYSQQMLSSNKFLSKQFVEEIEAGNRVFKPSIATRHLDTESIGLEYFAKQKRAVKGRKYPEVTGELKITSDLCPCPSCSAIFQQCTDMFPNLNLKIVTTSKLHY